MPFGTGPRICIGGTFAMMEMVAALATMLQSVRFDLAADTHCEPIQRVTLRPKGGLRLHVRSLNSI
jgi:cytochrome P450